MRESGAVTRRTNNGVGASLIRWISWPRWRTCDSAEMPERDKNGEMPMANPTGYRPNESLVQEANAPSEGQEHRPSVGQVPFDAPASDLLTVIGRDGCFKRLAPLFPPAFGYVEEELLDRPFLSFIHPADTAATSAALEQLARGEPTLGLENRFRCKDASYRRLAWTAIPTPESLLYAVARDITQRKQPE